jgi:hypothetical protein
LPGLNWSLETQELKMNMRIFAYPLIIIALALGMSACGEEVKTIDWYINNPDAMAKMNKKCANNPGKFRDDPNCINAGKAYLKKKYGM